MTPRRRKWLGRSVLALCGAIGGPLGAELVIQLVGDPRRARLAQQIATQPAWWKLASEGLLEVDDRALRFRLKAGFRATVDGVDYRINALGLRGPELARKKSEGTRRVLLVGDSYAFGLGVAEGDSIAARLEERLNATAADAGNGGAARAPFEVLNFGVPAYQTEQERLLLERVGFALEPDVVVLLYFANDKLPSALTWAPAIQALYHDEVPVPYEWKPLLARSYLYAIVARWEFARRYARGDYDARGAQHWPLTAQRIETLAEACRARGVAFVLAAIPELSTTAELRDESGEVFTDHAAVLALAARHSWPCVDLRAGLLAQVKAVELLYLSAVEPVDPHFNPRGCKFAADLIAPSIPRD